jgi:hypothetical protein
MRYRYTYKIGKLEEADRGFYERLNPGYQCTGETLEERYEEEHGRDGGGQTLVVFKAVGRGKKHFTPYGMCRDCGDHYIIARWSRYDRIDKATLEIERDVEDR